MKLFIYPHGLRLQEVEVRQLGSSSGLACVIESLAERNALVSLLSREGDIHSIGLGTDPGVAYKLKSLSHVENELIVHLEKSVA